jgi:hypothetical protein
MCVWFTDEDLNYTLYVCIFFKNNILNYSIILQSTLNN